MKPRKIRLSGKDIQRQIIDLLRAHNWVVRPAPRNGTKAIRGAYSVPKGEPDLMCERQGLVTYIEVKGYGDKLSIDQTAWIEEARKLGKTVIVAESKADAEWMVR